ncbi:hypothetical protein LEP1GSC058_1866 [Leptospira fainei serovar Hurstbridge str. BUT 6]|uniref:Uncharacterized protein n=1 Tax=Leptospira fainei serovar Hurstbridge str. BUT 6 TaxID=1193011 RepID=S3W3E5_9LEPT|nr:hypothetical protein LEP1GSC058_1866 [Leptospira fainei serovar Hurstbridge str. BUT 6]
MVNVRILFSIPAYRSLLFINFFRCFNRADFLFQNRESKILTRN